MTQHRCTEELRQLREDASHETTSRTKHWGSPSKNQALGDTDPREQIGLRRPAVSTSSRAAAAGRWRRRGVSGISLRHLRLQ